MKSTFSRCYGVFLSFFEVHDFHHFSSLTSSLIFTSSLSLSLSFRCLISSFLSLRFLLWSFLSLFCVVAAVVAASAAALLPLVAAAAVTGCFVVAAGARFGAVFRYFRLCSLTLRPLLSSCQVHSSARRVACMSRPSS